MSLVHPPPYSYHTLSPPPSNLFPPNLPSLPPSPFFLTSQPLQLPQHNNIRIQEPIHALPHTRLLVFIQLPVFDSAGWDAFAETGVCETVDCCSKGWELVSGLVGGGWGWFVGIWGLGPHSEEERR